MTVNRNYFESLTLRNRSNGKGRKQKARTLNFESLENRELLDAAGLETAALCVDVPLAETAAPAQSGSDAIDLSALCSSADRADELTTKLATPVVAPLGPVATDYFQIVLGTVEHATTYRVFYATSTQGLAKDTCNYQDFSKSGLATVTGLQDGVTYYVAVQALDSTGEYEASDRCEHFRCRTATQMRAPKLVDAGLSSPTSVSVQIKSALKHADSYDFEIASDKDYVDVLETRTVSVASTGANPGAITFTGLMPNTTYYVHVRGNSNDAAYLTSPFSAGDGADAFSTTALTAPTLTVQAVDFHAALLSYAMDAAASSELALYVEYSQSADFVDAFHKTVNTLDASSGVELTGLDAGAVYYARAKLVLTSDAGTAESDWSASVSAQTPEEIALDAPTLTIDSGFALAAHIGAVANADAYALEYAADASFENAASVGFSAPGDYELQGLTPDVLYYFRAKAISETEGLLDSEYSATASGKVVSSVQLDAPTLTIESATESSAAIEIGAVENALAYLVEYSDFPSFAESTKAAFASSGTHEIAGLDAETTYYFRVCALGDGTSYINSENSATAVVTTPKREEPTPETVLLGAPNLAIVGQTATAVQIKLDAIEGASTYVLEYGTDPTFADATTKTYAAPVTRWFTGLSSDTTYYFRAKACANDAAESDFSSIQAAPLGVAESVDKLGEPTLTILAKTATAVQIKLDAVEGASGYVLEYAANPSFNDAKTKTYSASTKTWLSGFDSDATYYFRVKAIADGYLASNPSSVQVVALGTPAVDAASKLGEPTLTIASKTKTAVQIKLDGVENATNYVLEYATDPSFTNSRAKYYFGSTTRWLTGLASDTTYYFRATALASGYLASNDCSTQVVTLGSPAVDPPAVKLAPPVLTILYATKTAVQIKLDGAANASNYVLEYSQDAEFADARTKTYSAEGTRWLTGLDSGAAYYFRVKAVASDYVESDWSAVAANRENAAIDAALQELDAENELDTVLDVLTAPGAWA